jgi:RibD C-terminal domain
MTILGSGSIVRQLAQEGLIDEYQLMMNPVVARQGENDVRWHQGEVDPEEADNDTGLL